MNMETLKNKLNSIIEEMKSSSRKFVRNPLKDFTRNRKINFDTVISMLLTISRKTIDGELLDYTDNDIETPTASAFIQQRNKLLPSTFEHIFHEFTDSVECPKMFEDYRLIAFDGSAVNIPHDPDEPSTYFKPKGRDNGYNQIHLNAMYDLCNNRYIDAIINPRRKYNEYRALADMVDRSKIPGKTIIVADRGLESYNVFAHLEEKGWNYVIRVKDASSNGITSTAKLPQSEEYDTVITRTLTTKKTKEVMENTPNCWLIPTTVVFDFLNEETDFYTITFRVVCIKLDDGSFETLFTNLDADEFPPEKLKEVYRLRWGVETSFRKLKYALSLNFFHSKKLDSITQEVFARLTMYNFSSAIASCVEIVHDNKKHFYQVNFSRAVGFCRLFLRNLKSALDIEKLIRKYILPVRPGRKCARNHRAKAVESFNFR